MADRAEVLPAVRRQRRGVHGQNPALRPTGQNRPPRRKQKHVLNTPLYVKVLSENKQGVEAGDSSVGEARAARTSCAIHSLVLSFVNPYRTTFASVISVERGGCRAPYLTLPPPLPASPYVST